MKQDSSEQIGPDYLKLILNAPIYEVAIETQCQLAKKLSKRLGTNIYFKREDQQPVNSFKIRGAYYKIKHLYSQNDAVSEQIKTNGVICVSAGNHAQGVALSAKFLKINATIVMPLAAPAIKVQAVESHGANVVLFGNDFDEAKQECLRLTEEQKMVFIHPFDDPYVIAGQGTIGLELLRQCPSATMIFCCVGGGGLLAGVSTFMKRIKPQVKIIGVNTVDSNSMQQSLIKGEVVTLTTCGAFSDGTAVRKVGDETFRLCKENVDDFILVTTDEICAAIRDVFEDTRSILEPSGALSLAGAKKYLLLHPEYKNETVAVVLSGANVNFDRLRFISERSRLSEGKEVLLSLLIPEKPGAFKDLYNIVHPRNVSEFSYRFCDPEEAQIFLGFFPMNVSQRDEEVEYILKTLTAQQMRGHDITNDEFAKCHLRYLAGGRSITTSNEQLLRFNFPERPGALAKFLNTLSNDFNVSLFHYRNDGGDLARVLVGLQVPKDDMKEYKDFLNKLGYPYVDETQNPIYKEFLLK